MTEISQPYLSFRIATVALGAAIACTPAFAYDISSLLDVSYPAELVSAAQGERIAWIANERGIRNVWTASPPRFVPQMLTHWTDDDGQELSSLRLSREGSTVVWVRGGHPDNAGFSQNPLSLPGGVEQEVWIATANGQPRKLGTGDSPVLSPDGRVVLVSQGQTISCLSATSAAAPDWCTAPLLKLRGSNGRPAFSPDGRRIAFVSDRNDHSFIGVLDTVAGKVTWLVPDVDRDDFPVWSPDGTHVAFIRISGERFGELLNVTGAWPFEIWIVDVTNGVGRRVFHDFHGVHDWAQMAKDLHGAGRGIDESLYDLAYKSSPDAAAAKWRSPVLFIHGDDDRSVPFNQTTDLVRRLRGQEVHVETLIFPDEEHGFLLYATWLRAYAATAEFLTRTLGASSGAH